MSIPHKQKRRFRGAVVAQKSAETHLMQFVQSMSMLASMGHCIQPDPVHIAHLVDQLTARDIAASEENRWYPGLDWCDI